MTIKLTTPENFDRLIAYLENDRGVTWQSPEYRNQFIAEVKKQMEIETVLLDVCWRYDAQKNVIDADLFWSTIEEYPTDEDFLIEKGLND